jgi:hypothetical protein
MEGARNILQVEDDDAVVRSPQKGSRENAGGSRPSTTGRRPWGSARM